MKAVDLIRFAMNLSEQGTARLVADMRDAALTQPVGGGGGGGGTDGNHALWCLGHLTYIEGSIAPILFGEPNPVERWAPLFATGTQPQRDASVYPSFDEVLAAYRDLRQRNLKLLDRLSDADLDRAPAHVPPGFEALMTSVGNTLLLVTLHNMVHYGEIAVARRAAGRKPLM
jgi:hypothetical protein